MLSEFFFFNNFNAIVLDTKYIKNFIKLFISLQLWVINSSFIKKAVLLKFDQMYRKIYVMTQFNIDSSVNPQNYSCHRIPLSCPHIL